MKCKECGAEVKFIPAREVRAMNKRLAEMGDQLRAEIRRLNEENEYLKKELKKKQEA